MSAVVVLEKLCGKCERVLPASAFHKNRSRSDGLSRFCGECSTAATKAWSQFRRDEMGEEAWREYRRSMVRKSRERRDMDSERRYNNAKHRATAALIAAHRKEFDALFARERYEADREAAS